MKKRETNGRETTVVSTVDAVGLFCPMPIVHLSLALEDLSSNQVVEILADDAGFEDDVAHWCAETKNPLLLLKKTEDNIFVAYVKKA